MSQIPNSIFFIFFALSLIIFFIWNKRNKNYLTIEEKKSRQVLLSEAWQREMKYIWAIIAVLLTISGFLLILEKVFAVNNASEFIFVLGWFSLIYAIFRNRAIYRKANLPQEFVKGDVALGVFTIAAFAVAIVFIFAD